MESKIIFQRRRFENPYVNVYYFVSKNFLDSLFLCVYVCLQPIVLETMIAYPESGFIFPLLFWVLFIALSMKFFIIINEQFIAALNQF